MLLVLNWDGKAITGTINPGTDNMAIKNATLNPEGWVVHLEADAKDKAGAVVTYVIDGKIENLAMHNRGITGTWKSQRGSGAFEDQPPVMRTARGTAMSLRPAGVLIVAVAALIALATDRGAAHHAISAKFDDTKPQTLTGIVTLVDWRNPHVHVFLNVQGREGPAAQLGGRAREPDRPAAERLEQGLAAARRRHHRAGHPGAQRQPAGVGTTRSS